MLVKEVFIPQYVAGGARPPAVWPQIRVRVQDRFCYVSTPGGTEIQLDQAGVFELTRACKAAFVLVTN